MFRPQLLVIQAPKDGHELRVKHVRAVINK